MFKTTVSSVYGFETRGIFSCKHPCCFVSVSLSVTQKHLTVKLYTSTNHKVTQTCAAPPQEAGERIRACKREACGPEQAAALNLDAPEEVGRLLFEDMRLQPPPGAVTISKRSGRPKYSTKVCGFLATCPGQACVRVDSR